MVGCLHHVFPPPLLKGVDHEFDFARWRMVSSTIEQKFLHPGNRLMIVDMTRGAKLVGVDDVVRSLPSLDAHCIHMWKTGHVDIADVASSGADHGVLEEEPFCRAGMN